MRQIKFRAKMADNKEWVLGYYCLDAKGIAFIESLAGYRVTAYEIIPETVGQFTGLKDVNGIPIYEGDVITAPHFSPLIIGYSDNNAAFVGSKTNEFNENTAYHFAHDIVITQGWEVIGNIHENVELVK